MMETTRPQRESAGGGPSVLGSIFDSRAAAETAMVTHGPYAEALPVAGLTIGQIRQRFADRLDLDPHSQATVDGEEADDQTVVRAGQVVIFIRRAGEKGSSAF